MALIPAAVGTILFPACSRSGGHTLHNLLSGACSRAPQLHTYCPWLTSNTFSMRLEGDKQHAVKSGKGLARAQLLSFGEMEPVVTSRTSWVVSEMWAPRA